MPQTREHLAIIDLLEIQKGVVVITKKDLVDDELLTLVRMEIEELIDTTALSGAPVVGVSALNGDGIPELIATIDDLLATTEPRRDLGRPRLAIDRVFTMTGSGTVVTGTLIDGSLAVGQEVEIMPPALKTRLRGLQSHKTRLDTATPGSRVAANLVGVNTAQVQRGDVMTKPGWLVSTTMLTVKLKLLSYLHRSLRHGATVSFHTGAAEAMAKIRLLSEDELKPGQTAWAQVSLDRPLATVNGDHFIIRSPMETLGGGRIIESHARRLRRFRPDVIENLQARETGTAEEMVLALLETKQPVGISALIAELNLRPEEAKVALDSLVAQGKAIDLGRGENSLLVTAKKWESVVQKTKAALQEYHRKFPTRLGMLKVEMGSRLKLGASATTAFHKLAAQDVIVDDGTVVRLPTHQIQLNQVQQARVDAFLRSLAGNPYAPPGDSIPEPDLLNLLIEGRQVVKVGSDVVFAASAYDEMVTRVTSRIKAEGQITLAEVRDMFQTSRKYAQALLEHLDGEKITRRVGDARVLY
jgi:selenocysteine-specific elongation factor